MLRRLASILATVLALSAAPLVPSSPAIADSVKACAIVSGPESGVIRIGGADRYEVSAAVSATFPQRVDVAFIASGVTFPDALSGSPIVGRLGGPVLLVGGGDMAPPSVQLELSRLQPKKIVILGGVASISTALEFSLERYSPTVERIAGADRFAISVELARRTYGTRAQTIYVASGEVYPDALSASAAAGDADAPVLLVKRDEIPSAIESFLASQTRLEQIVLIGGPATVSDAVALGLALFGRLQRIPGADRYAVSAATSGNEFCAERFAVYIASGEVFPDALSGSALAVSSGAPVLLVSRDQVSLQVEQELRRLNPAVIVVLGGENSISKSLELKLANYLRK